MRSINYRDWSPQEPVSPISFLDRIKLHFKIVVAALPTDAYHIRLPEIVTGPGKFAVPRNNYVECYLDQKSGTAWRHSAEDCNASMFLTDIDSRYLLKTG